MPAPAGSDWRRARRLALAAAACAGATVIVLIVSIVLNDRALGVENGIVSDGAFGPLVMGIFLAGAAGYVGLRTAEDPTRDGATAGAILAVAAAVVAVIGAFVAIGEPSVFNADYGCISQRTDAWLAVALRPTPAPCGYLIPASDAPLFFPAAFAAFAAAVLAVVSALLNLASRSVSRA